MSFYVLLPALAPVLLLAGAAFLSLRKGTRPPVFRPAGEALSLAALLLALAGVAQLLLAGPAQLTLLDEAFALILRLDAISVTMTVLVAFVGWIVMRYTRTYLAGEPGEKTFQGLMLATLAVVLELVQAGSLPILVLAFAGIGFFLRKLLLFYADRPAARRAATKFTLVWHAGDLALFLSSILFLLSTGTVDIARLPEMAGTDLSFTTHLAVAFLVLAALLKTAAFPLHGWLTEVMEAPTPVSALLHAGIINAGGFLLIRTADLVQASPGAMGTLVALGGLTALFGAVVMLTQSAVKTALAWSTISQMGFMLLQCGLGLWPLALLHIIAHSLYKAHAFLSSGGAIAAVARIRRPGPIAVPGFGAVAKSFAVALLLYALVSLVFTLVAGPKTPQALAIGAMLIFGVAYLVAQGFADAAPAELTRRTGVSAVLVALAYFLFQLVSHAFWGHAVPAVPTAGPLEWALIVLAVFSFGLVALAQTLFPLWSHHPAATGLRVHVANGFYINALLDRMTGGYRAGTPH